MDTEGEEHSTDVMRIARPDDLADLAALGLTLAEGKRILAGVQREIVAAQARCTRRAVRSAVAAARPRRAWDGRRMPVRRRSWTGCGLSSPPS